MTPWSLFITLKTRTGRARVERRLRILRERIGSRKGEQRLRLRYPWVRATEEVPEGGEKIKTESEGGGRSMQIY